MTRLWSCLLVVCACVVTSGCAAERGALQLVPDASILADELRKLPTVQRAPRAVVIRAHAPAWSTGEKYISAYERKVSRDPPVLRALAGPPDSSSLFDLQYPAGKILAEVAEVSRRRWFGEESVGVQSPVAVDVEVRSLIYDSEWDAGYSGASVEASLDVQVVGLRITQAVGRGYSSGMLESSWPSEWVWVGANDRGRVGEHHQPIYMRLVYRAMLVALDKAMADIAARIEEQEKAGSGAGQGR